MRLDELRCRSLGILLLLGEPAWAARIVVSCYDGAPSASVGWGTERPTTRLNVCDLDHRQDGRCVFRVSLGAKSSTIVPRVFDVTLSVGQMIARHTRAVLKCHAGPEPNPVPCQPKLPPSAITYTCQEAVLADPTADPACDFDQVCDDSCTFAFRCPPNCGLGPCFTQPKWPVQVAVGCRSVLPACDHGVQPTLVLECQPRPAGFVCPSTTTTLPPPGYCRGDDDCVNCVPACQHCEAGACQGLPTIEPNRSIYYPGCAIPCAR